MHPTLVAFADRYRHAFPDLVITTTADGEDLRLEWQETPATPCFTVKMLVVDGKVRARIEWEHGIINHIGDPIDAASAAFAQIHRWSRAQLIGKPGTFGAVILARRLMPNIRPDSPDYST